MNTIRVQARLVLGALLTAVLAFTAVVGTGSTASAASAPDSTSARAAAPKGTVAKSPTLTLAPRQAGAPACWRQGRRCFGALTLNWRTQRAFGVFDYRTKHGAQRAAYKMCVRNASNPKNCEKQTWTRNSCTAVATRVSGGYVHIGRSWNANSMKAAKRAARKVLGWRGTVRGVLCTTRSR